MLLVPMIPLHNNGSELKARVSARRRDVSLHSRSVRGVRAMDIFTTIVQTAKLHSVSAYAYFRDRINQRFVLPSLAASFKPQLELRIKPWLQLANLRDEPCVPSNRGGEFFAGVRYPEPLPTPSEPPQTAQSHADSIPHSLEMRRYLFSLKSRF